MPHHQLRTWPVPSNSKGAQNGVMSYAYINEKYLCLPVI